MTQLTRERITSARHRESDWFWCLYENSFPQGERRSLAHHRHILPHPKYHLEIWFDKAVPVGFTALWTYSAFQYLEHFAVAPDKRSGGYGSRILSTLLAAPHPPLILEIDPPTDDISRRRHAFYHRLGFVDNPAIQHSHPDYYTGLGSVPLLLLSNPAPIAENTYAAFKTAQNTEMLSYFL